MSLRGKTKCYDLTGVNNIHVLRAGYLTWSCSARRTWLRKVWLLVGSGKEGAR